MRAARNRCGIIFAITAVFPALSNTSTRKKAVEAIHPDIIHFSCVAADDNATAEVAMQYNDSYNELILSFANNIHTTDGGTHEDGFKRARHPCDERLRKKI